MTKKIAQAKRKASRIIMDDALLAIEPLIAQKLFDEIQPILTKRKINSETIDRDGRQFFWYIVSSVDSRMLTFDDPLVECVRYFLELGADIDHFDYFGDTVLHVASVRSNPAVVQLLLDYGATIDVVNDHGFTPLDMAIMCFEDDQPEVVSLLLEAGADPHRRIQGNMAYATPAICAETMDVSNRRQLKDVFFDTLERIERFGRKRRRIKRRKNNTTES